MTVMNRRELLKRTGFGLATAAVAGVKLVGGLAAWDSPGGTPGSSPDWIRNARIVLAEGYNPPFYPSFEYDPEKAVSITRQLNAEAMRYPAASYFAYFPTKTQYPIHPELGDRDPFQRTVELFHDAGLKVIAYNPLNHPFMDVHSNNPNYQDWMKRYADGRPMITRHYGWTEFYEGCLNSPFREVVKTLVEEVLTNYPVDLMYFDGPYQGMDCAENFCHCRYCESAYEKAHGKGVPNQDKGMTLEEEIEYRKWMAGEVVVGFLGEIREMIHQKRDVPVVYNDTALLNKHDWRARGFTVVDGFMFEAVRSPEEKLLNLQLGNSTGKVIWTYVGSHTEYNREHMRDDTVRGWYSHPLEGEELGLDGTIAVAGNAGVCYWGLDRLFYLPQAPLAYGEGRRIKAVFDFLERHAALLRSVRPISPAAVLVPSQSIDWYRGKYWRANQNYYQGAYLLLKHLGYDVQPFLDYQIRAEDLAKYRLVYVPNAPCLSQAQCELLGQYVENGGSLVVTHLTAVADEYGRERSRPGLGKLLGIRLESSEPVEIPDLYLRLLPSGKIVPQDPQVMRFQVEGDAEVMAETQDRGHRSKLGPAIVRRKQGKGEAIYIGSGLEAIYVETLNEELRTYMASLLDPVLSSARTYEVEGGYQAGLMAQYANSEDVALLHLLVDRGSIWKKQLVQETFLPMTNLKVRIRLPEKRRVRGVSLLWEGGNATWQERGGWVEVMLPSVEMRETVQVRLA
jgi:glycosyl hydrolase family 42 (putative beta-galactosidase)/putative glycosyl hydrolase-like family 6 (GHL6) protein